MKQPSFFGGKVDFFTKVRSNISYFVCVCCDIISGSLFYHCSADLLVCDVLAF